MRRHPAFHASPQLTGTMFVATLYLGIDSFKVIVIAFVKLSQPFGNNCGVITKKSHVFQVSQIELP